MTTLQEVVAAIDSFDKDQLDIVATALRAREKYVREAAARQALATLQVGQKVTLKGLSPKYLNGLTGTITARDGEKFSVEFDEHSAWQARRYGKNVRVPPGCIDPVTEGS
jgi:hypothetical protein